MPTKYNRRRQRNRKTRKIRNQRGGELSYDTIRRLTAQYYVRLPGGIVRDRPRPNLMEINEFVRENNIQEPFYEVVRYITSVILRSLLAPIPEPENVSPERLEAFRAEVRRLAELARPPR